MDWFTVEQLDETTFSISEYQHWEEFHSYLVIGDQRAALIDTGIGIGNIRTLVETLTHLPVSVITTHVHWDHIGGHHLFDRHYVHQDDVDWFKHGLPLPIEVIRNNVLKSVDPVPRGFQIEDYHLFTGTPTGVLSGGERIDLGNRYLDVLHTPGHSPGHICILDHDRKYAFTGDLVYEGTLYAFYPSTDPVAYRDSVHRLCGEAKDYRVLPSHHNLNLPGDFLTRVCTAFDQLEEEGHLVQGSGVFSFDSFSIHV